MSCLVQPGYILLCSQCEMNNCLNATPQYGIVNSSGYSGSGKYADKVDAELRFPGSNLDGQ
jgi:hypothetical protein